MRLASNAHQPKRLAMPSTKNPLLTHPFKRTLEVGFLPRYVDILILVVTAHLSELMCFTDELGATAPIHRVLLYFCCGVAFFTFPHTGIYASWRGRFMPSMLWRLATSWALVLLLGLVFGFAIHLIGGLSRLWLLYWFMSGIFCMALYRIAAYFAMGYFRTNGYNLKRVVIVGYGKTGQEMHERAVQLADYGYEVVAIHSNNDKPSEPSKPLAATVVRIEKLENIPGFIAEQNIQEVWITLPLSASQRLVDLQYLLRNALVDIRWVPDLLSLQLLSNRMINFLGLPTIDLNRPITHGMPGVLKHILDKMFATAVLTLLTPLFVAVALGIKLTSKGPIFFTQTRLGLNGKPFQVIKFRSMRIHDEHDAHGKVVQATQDDPRITKFGQFLRRTSIDELPQFINVLIGDMSVVGPRPHAMQHNQMYEELLDMYMARHRVKPGITGWAQIHGLRGETDTLDKMKKRVQFDLHYIQNWSLLMDLRILIWTTFNGWAGKNVY